ncbi:MAG: Crp/Fnr family transcriptional regulator [Clostridiaceae bacterium]|nr:Crp/Fnr family transcriptional regulator [Clostridiaceae bacterium]
MQLMKNEDWLLLKQSRLFKGIEEREMKHLLLCLQARKKHFEENECILHYGTKNKQVGILLSGSANITRYDYWGKRHIVTALLPSDLFGESIAALPDTTLTVEIEATSNTNVIFLNIENIIQTCAASCTYHTQLIQNYVMILASKNLYLVEKMRHITQPTLKNKILSYLSSEAMRLHSSHFDIPFDRQELADYLNADRSAVSNELSKMKKQGILDYHKNHFQLLIPDSNP